MAANAMATCCSQSDRFNSRSKRTMTGRCRSWMRTWQRGNMPILLKTQIERTAKAPIPACHARVGSLCDFQDTVERVPAGSPKTGRCTAVRERWRKMLVLARTAAGKVACGKRGTRQNGQNLEILDAATRKQDKAAGSCAPRSGHICPPCGQFRGFTRAFQKQRKTAGGRCRMKKVRRFKENSGVPTKFTR